MIPFPFFFFFIFFIFFIFKGQNAHVLLSTLVKHLDNKNLVKQPNIQLEIVEVTTSLAQHAHIQCSVAILGAVRDIMRHWRKSIHCSDGDEKFRAELQNSNERFREAVDKCLIELSYKVSLISIGALVYFTWKRLMVN